MVTTITAPSFQGAFTALITPFRGGEIDEPALREGLPLRHAEQAALQLGRGVARERDRRAETADDSDAGSSEGDELDRVDRIASHPRRFPLRRRSKPTRRRGPWATARPRCR